MTKKQRAPAPRSAFDRLVRAVELETISLRSVTAKPGDALSDDPAEWRIFMMPSAYMHRYDAEDKTMVCGVRVGVAIGDDVSWQTESNDPLAAGAAYQFNAEYIAVYKVDWQGDAPSEEDLETAVDRFASQNAIFNVWPFFRELVHSLAARVGYPPLFTPLLRLPVDANAAAALEAKDRKEK